MNWLSLVTISLANQNITSNMNTEGMLLCELAEGVIWKNVEYMYIQQLSHDYCIYTMPTPPIRSKGVFINELWWEQVNLRYLDGLENNTATSCVLVFHQFLSVLTFLIRWSLEELAEALECYIITVKVHMLQDKNNTTRYH